MIPRLLDGVAFLNRVKRTRVWSHPVFLVFAALLGVGIMVGAPLIAQDHEDAGHARTEESHATAPGHGATAGHEGGEEAGEPNLHFPTLVSIVAAALEGHQIHDHSKQGISEIQNPTARFLMTYEDPIYSAIIIILLTVFFASASRRLNLVPGPLQNLAEILIGGLDDFIRGVIGPEGRRFVPFLGTIGLYIYVMNIAGMFPLMKSPTSVLNTTAALALCVFVYVQYTGIRALGPVGFLKHLAGDPHDAVGWAMVPLQLPLHVIGELTKPLSLSLRLFGNIMGEDLLLAVFAGLGVSMFAALHVPFGFPLQVPFMFLGLLTTLIQALVFMLLSTIYISLVLPHHEHEGGH